MIKINQNATFNNFFKIYYIVNKIIDISSKNEKENRVKNEINL